jgi:hypothetical protein
VPVIGHTHPAPPWPDLPGGPLGLTLPVRIEHMAGLLGAVLDRCADCVSWRTDRLLSDNPAPIAALAAQLYSPLPVPSPEVPAAVRAVAQVARECAAAGTNDYRPVMHAVVMLSRGQRGIVAMDLTDLAAAVAGGRPPDPPQPS